MTITRAALTRRLDELGIAHSTVEHPAVFTVAQSTALDRQIPGGHTKNLFLADARGRLRLVIAHAHTRIDLKALGRTLGARLSFGSAALLQTVLGVAPGSVTALALINDPAGRVGVVLDEQLMAHDPINCHPLENTATTSIARDDLLRFIRACGHEPRILYLGSAGGGAREPAGTSGSGHPPSGRGADAPGGAEPAPAPPAND